MLLNYLQSMTTSSSNDPSPEPEQVPEQSLSFGQKLSRWLSFLCSGFALGILAGLSSSPVASDLITGLLTVIVSMILVASGLKMTKNIPLVERVGRISVNPVPIATTVGGITMGTLVGIIIKVNGLLIMPGLIEAKWERYDLPDDVSQVVFDMTFGLPYSLQTDTSRNDETTGTPDQNDVNNQVSPHISSAPMQVSPENNSASGQLDRNNRGNDNISLTSSDATQPTSRDNGMASITAHEDGSDDRPLIPSSTPIIINVLEDGTNTSLNHPVIPSINTNFLKSDWYNIKLKTSCEMLLDSIPAKELRAAILNDSSNAFSKVEYTIAHDTISDKEFYDQIKALCE